MNLIRQGRETEKESHQHKGCAKDEVRCFDSGKGIKARRTTERAENGITHDNRTDGSSDIVDTSGKA